MCVCVKVGLPLEDEVFEQAMDMSDIDGSGALDVSYWTVALIHP